MDGSGNGKVIHGLVSMGLGLGLGLGLGVGQDRNRERLELYPYRFYNRLIASKLNKKMN